MKHLLFVAHRIPFPPDKGDKIRSFNVLRYLAERFHVHLGAFMDDPRETAFARELEAYSRTRCLLPLHRWTALARGGCRLLGGSSLSLGYFSDRRMHGWVRRTGEQFPLAAAYAFSSAMAPYAADLPGARRVVDFCDVDSVKWSQYARSTRGLRKTLLLRETTALARAEREYAAKFDACLFVSAHEASLFGGAADRVQVMRNGVDSEYFDPRLPCESPYPADVQPLAFVGAMDYAPNIDAVVWFCERVLPLLRERSSTLRFYIVGSRPTSRVLRLTHLPGVTVTGRVPDVRPYVRHARCVVAPLRIARGVQNKVLEALAMGTRIVGTPQAFEGIDPPLGDFALCASTPAEFLERVWQVLERSAAWAPGAREFVTREFQWARNLRILDRLLDP